MNVRDTSVSSQPWLFSPAFDLCLIVGPAVAVTLVLGCFFEPTAESARAEMSLAAWLLFVVGIDVAHVWSTLFRTYLDPEERARYRVHLTIIPLLCWVVGVLLYSAGAIVFWSVLAYAAVFHFVRQQYGFYALYARGDKGRSSLSREIDIAAVYLGTLYPLLYWHAHLPRHFVWFVEGDFPFAVPGGVSSAAGWLLVVTLFAQVVKEGIQFARARFFNLPKNLVIWGTVASWFVGIVYFNADVPFTIANVAAHGIPYVALVWAFGAKKHSGVRNDFSLGWFFSLRGALAFIIILLVLGFAEELLWDAFVWRERREIFGWAWILPPLEDRRLLSLMVPLLSLPQATHYIVDAFIWRIRKPSSELDHLLT